MHDWPGAAYRGGAAELLAFYDFPTEHWIHLRTTNPIGSTFSTVKLRTKVTRGAGSPAAVCAMVFKLVESAQPRWRAITGTHLVSLVRAGARFENGVLVEREKQAARTSTTSCSTLTSTSASRPTSTNWGTLPPG